MYDEYARKLIESIPELPDIDRDACRRALSAAYFYILRLRLGVTQDDVSRQDLEEIKLLLRGLGDALESIAVFDRLNKQDRPIDVENACAFVAAEALALLMTLLHNGEGAFAKDPCGVLSADDSVILDVNNWLDVFFNVMSLLPPKQVQQYLADEARKRPTVLTKLRDKAHNKLEIDTVPWEIPQGWSDLWYELEQLVVLYMRGGTYAEIARTYLGLSESEVVTNKRSSGSHPIPTVFGFLRKVVDSLLIDAGCFLAIQEYAIYSNGGDVPETLQALPLCIRNGCDSLGTLSWYRFGYRQRVCAHAFEAVFPVPRDLTDDHARAKWVRQTREQWLSGALGAESYPILKSAEIVIKEGSSV